MPPEKAQQKARPKPQKKSAGARTKQQSQREKLPLAQRLPEVLASHFGLRAAERLEPDEMGPLPELQDDSPQKASDTGTPALTRLWVTKVPAFVQSPRLLVGHHFTYCPDMLIFDPRGSTLGAVVVLPDLGTVEPSQDSPKQGTDPTKNLKSWVQTEVERAAYLCHLLLAEAQTQQRLPPTVELVLTLEKGREEDSEIIGSALRELARGTDLLHAIGVGLLYDREHEELLSPTSLRRAFPWLLHATRGWLGSKQVPLTAKSDPEKREGEQEERKEPAQEPKPRLPAESSKKLKLNAPEHALQAARKAAARDGLEANQFREDLLHIDGLRLTRYRLAESLRFPLDPASGIHLLHGHNGTGKSSLVEALELLFTGKVQRLERKLREGFPTQPPDDPELEKPRAELYDRIIRRRKSPDEARLALEVRTIFDAKADKDPTRRQWILPEKEQPAVEVPFPVSQERLPAPFCMPPLKAASFRLDQRLMDDLSHTSDARRAEAFLGAFFPEDQHLYEQANSLRSEAHEALETVEPLLVADPESLPTDSEERMELLERALAESFGWLHEDSSASPSEEQLRRCLPLGFDLLEELAHLEPDLGTVLEAWRQGADKEELPSLLLQVDDALEKIAHRLPTTLSGLRSSVECMQNLADWYVVDDTTPVRDFQTALDQWLEAFALADLADRRFGLVQTRQRAAELGWQTAGQQHVGFLPPLESSSQEVDRARRERDYWRQQREDCFHEVQRARENQRKTTRPTAGEETVTPPPHLSPSQVAGLNQTGPWIGASPDEGSFGDLCRDAARDAKHRTTGSITIGVRGWTEEPLQKLQALLEAGEALGDLGMPPTWDSGTSRRENLRTALKTNAALKKVELEVEETFLHTITAATGDGPSDSSLDQALNELLALFTPARWAYRDLHLVHDPETGGGSHLSLQEQGEDGGSAQLRLNTAELNLFTLALFLLCAPRLSNPFRLLVLDDPLQNMDELTVTTLARGLARLQTILPEGWRLLMLFHGEDDLDRFRHQLPAAPVYRLPWLRPLSSGDKVSQPTEVEVQVGLGPSEPLYLGSVIQEESTSLTPS